VLVRNGLGKEAILLVEGPTDVHFWRQVGREKVYPKPCNGREAVLKELRAVHAGGPIPGLLAVIDADWDHIEGTQHRLADLFTTDTRDLESMLVLCDARVHRRGLESRRPRRAEGLRGVRRRGPPSAALGERATLRTAALASSAAWLHLQVARPMLNDHVDPKTWRVDEAGLLKALVGLGLAPDEATLRAELAALPEQVQDAWLCRGHDLLILLARALSGPLKRAGQKRPPGQDELRDYLTLVAVRSDELYATRLFVALRAWGVQNPSYNFL
jgi:hypothetical protein